MLNQKILLPAIIIGGSLLLILLVVKPLRRNANFVEAARQLNSSDSTIDDISLDDNLNVFGFLMESHILAAKGDYGAAALTCEKAFQRTAPESELSQFIDKICKSRKAAATGDWDRAVNLLAAVQNDNPGIREITRLEFSTLLGMQAYNEWSSVGSVESYCLARYLLSTNVSITSLAQDLENPEIDCEEMIEFLAGHLVMENGIGCIRLAASQLNHASQTTASISGNGCDTASTESFRDSDPMNLVSNSGLSLPGNGQPAANVMPYYSGSDEYHLESIIETEGDSGRTYLSMAARREKTSGYLVNGKNRD